MQDTHISRTKKIWRIWWEAPCWWEAWGPGPLPPSALLWNRVYTRMMFRQAAAAVGACRPWRVHSRLFSSVHRTPGVRRRRQRHHVIGVTDWPLLTTLTTACAPARPWPIDGETFDRICPFVRLELSSLNSKIINRNYPSDCVLKLTHQRHHDWWTHCKHVRGLL